MPDQDPREEARRLREESLRTREGLGTVVARLHAERAITRRALMDLWQTAMGTTDSDSDSDNDRRPGRDSDRTQERPDEPR